MVAAEVGIQMWSVRTAIFLEMPHEIGALQGDFTPCLSAAPVLLWHRPNPLQ